MGNSTFKAHSLNDKFLLQRDSVRCVYALRMNSRFPHFLSGRHRPLCADSYLEAAVGVGRGRLAAATWNLTATVFLLACLGGTAVGQQEQVAASQAAERPYVGHEVWRVHPQSLADLRTAQELADIIWSCTPTLEQGIDIQVSPAKKAAISDWARQRGVPYTVTIPDVQIFLEQADAENSAARAALGEFSPRDNNWFTAYHTWDEINARMDELAAASNGLASTFIAGTSIQGRPMRGLRFTGPAAPGNPRDTRPQIMFQGLQHAREWIAPAVNMWIAQHLLEDGPIEPRIAAAMERFEFIVVPVINPDGYVHTWSSTANRLWRKNRRDTGGGIFGVDLNRNWGFQWGGEGTSTQRSSDIYRGTAPFSEPETAGLSTFITSLPRLRGHIDYHSFGQLVLSPFGYSSQPCPDERLFGSINADLLASVRVRHNRIHTGGPSYVAIYPASGVAPDWVYGARNVPAWTIELRAGPQSGFILPPEEIIPTCEENFDAVLTFIERLSPPILFTLPATHENFPLPGSPSAVQLSVRPSGSGAGISAVTAFIQPAGTPDFVPTAVTGLPGQFYEVTLPPATCGSSTQLRYYAVNTSGVGEWYPAGDESITITPAARTLLFSDDCESNQGWTLGTSDDTATGGIWQRANPERTYAQPEDDTSITGLNCFITGAAAGADGNANDVDGGITTLLSPVINALPPRGVRVYETRLTFSRWFYGPTNDPLITQLSDNGGATWVTADTIGQEYNRWVAITLRIDDFVNVTSQLRVRFVARDLGDASTVEAGIDDINIFYLGCRRNADVNNDGGVDGSDVETFFIAWAIGEPVGDFNEDGGTDGADIEEFFIVWQGG